MKELRTVATVIKELGGDMRGMNTYVAELTHKSLQCVTNWKAKDRFPPDTYLILQKALKEHQATAPARLWGIVEP